MPIVNTRDLVGYAKASGSAVPFIDIERAGDVVGALATAEALKTPLILAVAGNATSDFGFDIGMLAIEAAAERSSIPVGLHCTGVSDYGALVNAVRLGFGGVTIAGADIGSKDLAVEAGKLVQVADDCGVLVKRDLPAGADWTRLETPSPGAHVLGLSNDLATAWLASEGQRQNSGAAIGIRYRSAMSGEELKSLISRGVVWFSLEASRNRQASDLVTLVQAVRSGGRADEFSRNCRSWAPVEHVVEFNAPGLNEAEIDDLLRLGTGTLGAIPGVRSVRTGVAAKEDARYRYCWFIRFASPEVIAAFRDHPDHVAFADSHFRPVADDRLTTDYLVRSDRAQ